MGILIKSWLGVEVAFNGKFSACYQIYNIEI